MDAHFYTIKYENRRGNKVIMNVTDTAVYLKTSKESTIKLSESNEQIQKQNKKDPSSSLTYKQYLARKYEEKKFDSQEQRSIKYQRTTSVREYKTSMSKSTTFLG